MTLSGLVTGDQLDAETLPPLEWSVPGIVPEGLGILAAPPKSGKSWLVLAIGLAVAGGGEVLGVRVNQRPVLYLALEDGWRRLQSRCRQLLGDLATPGAMTFCIEPDGALRQAEQFIDNNVGANPLVILDALVTVKPQRRVRDEAYTADYGFTRKLKSLAAPGTTVLVVHHTRKAEAVDFLDAISGTQGIAGAADFVMVLDRERGDRTATLQVTGREVPEARYALLFDDGKWSADGNGLEEAAQRANESQLGHTKRLVLRFVNSRPVTRTADVAEKLNIKPDAARQTLSRLAHEGLIERLSPGVFVPVTQSQSYERVCCTIR